MSLTNHTFCWLGVISTDPARTTPYYAEVLGWTSKVVPMGDEDATLFAAADGKERAHTQAPAMEGVPSHWNNYLRVEDVDVSARKVVAEGGKMLVPGTDIPPGRFSVVASPSGATLTLFREADADSTDAGAGEGSIHWVELHSSDLVADLAWLKACFGLETQTMDMPSGPYHVLKSGDLQVGGAMKQERDGAPSMWLSWVQLADVDAAMVRGAKNGGKVITPTFEIPGIGRMGILADPTGGVFGVITPASA